MNFPAPPSRLTSGENCGLKPCTALRLCTPMGQGAYEPCFHHDARRRFFFAMLKNVHCAKAPFTKSPIAQPAPPTQYVNLIIATVAFSLQFSENFPDFTKGFFAHGHYKSRALRAKTIAAFSYPYAQKPFWDEKSCKNRASLFGGGKPPNPRSVQATLT